MGLNIISNASDILLLSSKDIDAIKRNKVWTEFRDNYCALCTNTDDFQRMVDFEIEKQKKIDKIKRIMFGITYGLPDIPISTIIGLIAQGFWGPAMGILLLVGKIYFSESRLYKRIQHATTDAFIDRLIQSKEPLYVISRRIGYQIEKELNNRN